MTHQPDFEHLSEFLKLRADSPQVMELIGQAPEPMKTFTYQGYVELKKHGISVMFKQAPWVIPSSEITDSEALYLDAFHFHREAHEGYSEYRGSLPGEVAFGDSLEAVVGKLGEPLATGGGGFSTVLKKVVPYWVRYSLKPDKFIQFQLDADGKVELATLYTPDLQHEY